MVRPLSIYVRCKLNFCGVCPEAYAIQAASSAVLGDCCRPSLLNCLDGSDSVGGGRCRCSACFSLQNTGAASQIRMTAACQLHAFPSADMGLYEVDLPKPQM